MILYPVTSVTPFSLRPYIIISDNRVSANLAKLHKYTFKEFFEMIQWCFMSKHGLLTLNFLNE